MARGRFVYSNKGFIALRKSSEVKELLREKAGKVSAAASASSGGTFEVEVKMGGLRAFAKVSVADYRAVHSVLRDNVLLKSVDAARY